MLKKLPRNENHQQFPQNVKINSNHTTAKDMAHVLWTIL